MNRKVIRWQHRHLYTKTMLKNGLFHLKDIIARFSILNTPQKLLCTLRESESCNKFAFDVTIHLNTHKLSSVYNVYTE